MSICSTGVAAQQQQHNSSSTPALQQQQHTTTTAPPAPHYSTTSAQLFVHQEVHVTPAGSVLNLDGERHRERSCVLHVPA